MTLRRIPLGWRIRFACGPAERWALSTWGAAFVFMAGLWIMGALVPQEHQGAGVLAVAATAGTWWWLWSGKGKKR